MIKPKRYTSYLYPILVILLITACSYPERNLEIQIYALPLLAGEVRSESVIFQARLTAQDCLYYEDYHNAHKLTSADIEGKKGWGRFLYATDSALNSPERTPWLEASAATDYILKAKVEGLQSNSKYYYQLEFGEDSMKTKTSRVQAFNTFPDAETVSEINFVMFACIHLERFYLGGGFGKSSSQGESAYRKDDKHLGFPGLKTIADMNPDFVISNGDNVYYDHPPEFKATQQAEMRAKWHRLYAMPRMQNLLSQTVSFWLKDDHDHRYDDSDTTYAHEKHGAHPTHKLGVNTFREQVPIVVDKQGSKSETYRTVRVNKLLQLWFLEGRDYRSPNSMPPGPEKTIWGEKQKAWLKETLLESDATFKIIVSPTPMVGPDDMRKGDNHTNPKGFRAEGDAFFQWLLDHNFLEKNLYFICGDRHWKYHSVHPTGFEEFSCGSLIDQNARLGRVPGDENSTDPEGLIKQPYIDQTANGGFLHISTQATSTEKDQAHLVFRFYDENGEELYSDSKSCKEC